MTDLGANAALRLACQLGDEQAARAALAAGADCNYVPPGEAGSSIAFAAWNGHGEICQMLLAAGAQANEREVMDAALAGGWIALAEWLRSSVAHARLGRKSKSNVEKKIHLAQVADRRAKNTRVEDQVLRRHRGERMAQAISGIVEHQLQLDESLAEAAARRNARAERLVLASRRRQEMAEAMEERYREMAQRTAARHEMERRVEVFREQSVVLSRRRTYEEEKARKASLAGAEVRVTEDGVVEDVPWVRARSDRSPQPKLAESPSTVIAREAAPTAEQLIEAKRGERRRVAAQRGHVVDRSSQQRPQSLLARISSSKAPFQEGFISQLRRVQSEHGLTEHALRLSAEVRATTLLEELPRREAESDGSGTHTSSASAAHNLARSAVSLPAIRGGQQQPESVGRAAARAAREGDRGALARWLASDESECLHFVDASGRTALHVACAAGQPACVRLLLAAGADAASVDHRRRTPMHDAVKAGSVEAVTVLLEHGARADALDAEGRTPLTLALRRKRGLGDSAIIELLEAPERNQCRPYCLP
jgi:ankyrin repeat protein